MRVCSAKSGACVRRSGAPGSEAVPGVGERLPRKSDGGHALAASPRRDRERLEQLVWADPRNVRVDHQQRPTRGGFLGADGPRVGSAAEQPSSALWWEGETLVPEPCESEGQNERVRDDVVRTHRQRLTAIATARRLLGAGPVEAVTGGLQTRACQLFLSAPPRFDPGLEA